MSGGSSGRTYFFDPSTASDIGGVYKVASPTPSANPETTIAQANTGTSFTLIATFATPLGDPNVLSIPAGIASRLVHAQTGASNQVGALRMEIYKRTAGGVETLLRTDDSHSFSDAVQEVAWDAVYSTAASLDATDRIIYRLYTARVDGPTTCDVTCYFDGNQRVSYAITTIPNPPSPLTVVPTSVAWTASINQCVLADTTAGSFAVTLPTAVGVSGQRVIVKKISSDGNTITVNTTGGQTIDGAASKAWTTQYQSLTVVSNGANWWVIATSLRRDVDRRGQVR